MDCSPPASSVHGISQQEYWSGFPFPSPGDLPDAGIEPMSPELAGGFFTPEPPVPNYMASEPSEFQLLALKYTCNELLKCVIHCYMSRPS